MMRLIVFILDLLLGWLFEDEVVVDTPCEAVEMPDTQPVQFKQFVFEFEPVVVDMPNIVVEQPAISWRDFKKYNQLVNSYLTSKGGDMDANSTIH